LIARWLPPLALMALIFYLSDQPRLGTDLGWIDVVLRKGAHMVEYGLLWLLLFRAFGWRGAGWAAAIAVGYAVSDELHQSTVDGRTGTPVDVAIDAAGVAVAAFAWSRLGFSRRPRAPSPARRGS
jgi:VanZ like family